MRRKIAGAALMLTTAGALLGGTGIAAADQMPADQQRVIPGLHIESSSTLNHLTSDLTGGPTGQLSGGLTGGLLGGLTDAGPLSHLTGGLTG